MVKTKQNKKSWLDKLKAGDWVLVSTSPEWFSLKSLHSVKEISTAKGKRFVLEIQPKNFRVVKKGKIVFEDWKWWFNSQGKEAEPQNHDVYKMYELTNETLEKLILSELYNLIQNQVSWYSLMEESLSAYDEMGRIGYIVKGALNRSRAQHKESRIFKIDILKEEFITVMKIKNQFDSPIGYTLRELCKMSKEKTRHKVVDLDKIMAEHKLRENEYYLAESEKYKEQRRKEKETIKK